ncbi:hypothetical protein BH11PLA1_BH11PLA1_09800 [soil metagenome]
MIFVSQAVLDEARDERLAPDPIRGLLIEQIVEINRTAVQDFLRQFDTAQLRDYLEHLEQARTPRGPHSRCQRNPSRLAAEFCESTI